jgi:hypothetical protein
MAKFKQLRPLDDIMKSVEITSILEGFGEQVLAAAQSDPNPAYVESLETQTFVGKSRVSVQVGAAPFIGTAVEAKRGTLAKALGSIGA